MIISRYAEKKPLRSLKIYRWLEIYQTKKEVIFNMTVSTKNIFASDT